MDERAAFERNIDENPLDATNHGVYADWLDEHGEGDEAAFRRSMGDWLGKVGSKIHAPERDPEFPWRAHYENVPDGVDGGKLPVWSPSREELDDHINNGTRPTPPDPTTSYPHHMVWQIQRWKTYRNMEEAFRRAHRAGRSQPERLSRWFLARRDARRRYGKV